MFAYSLWRPFASVAVCFCLAACAYATAVPVDYNSNKDGFRVYDVKPILIVNGQQITVELVPNYNKAYAVQFGAFLAKQDFTLDIQKGFITKIDSKQDSTAIIPLLQDIVKSLPLSGGKVMSGEVQGGVQDRFQVYDFVFSDDGSLIALRPLLDQSELLRVKTQSTQGLTFGAGQPQTNQVAPQTTPAGPKPSPGQ